MENDREQKDALYLEIRNDLRVEERSAIRKLKVDIIESVKKILLLIPNHSQSLNGFRNFYFNAHQSNTKKSISKVLSASLINDKLILSILINYQDVDSFERINEDDILGLRSSTKDININVESLRTVRDNLMFYIGDLSNR